MDKPIFQVTSILVISLYIFFFFSLAGFIVWKEYCSKCEYQKAISCVGYEMNVSSCNNFISIGLISFFDKCVNIPIYTILEYLIQFNPLQIKKNAKSKHPGNYAVLLHNGALQKYEPKIYQLRATGKLLYCYIVRYHT